MDDVETYRDKSTGTDTNRDGHCELIGEIEARDIETVVVNNVSRIARSIREIDRTAERVTQAGAEIHLIDEGLVMKPGNQDPYQNASSGSSGCSPSLRRR